MISSLSACLTLQLALSAVAPSVSASAQAVEPPPAQTVTSSQLGAIQATLEALQKEVEAERQEIARHAAEIARQRETIAELRKQLDGSHAAPPAVATAPAAATASAPAGPAQTAAVQADQTGEHGPDLPNRSVSVGEFPGSIEFPGTDMAFKLGGEARVTLIQTLGPLGVDDRFITSSIPVENQRAGDDARTTYTAAPSRLNFEIRAPEMGGFRTFIEYHFAGSGNTARLRHAFIQTPHWLVGQSWSTFSDPEARPTDIDFEGLNAISYFRQAQVRYTRPLSEHLEFAASIENPAPDLTDAQGVNAIPDFVGRLRWEPNPRARELLTEVSHVQAAVLGRALRGELNAEPEKTLATGGFGVDLSGVVVPKWDRTARIRFAGNSGWGIGRYIKDLESLGGQDAVYDATTDQLRALRVGSAYVGYEHRWWPRLQSTLTYGVVRVTNLDIQPDDALKRTQRASFSFTFNPIPRMDMTVEFLAGERVNKNGHHGSSTQVQSGWRVRF